MRTYMHYREAILSPTQNSFSRILNSFNPVTGEESTPLLQSALKIDRTDSTQEVRSTGSQEQVNPQHHSTYVHYTCRQSLQPSTTTQAVSTHNILRMDSKVNGHKTQSSLVCHSMRSLI